jgi:hypothetical protein
MDWQKDIADSVFSMYILNKLNDDEDRLKSIKDNDNNRS